MNTTLLEQLKSFGVVPVVVLEHVQDAAPLAKALEEGGLPVAEVTFRTKAARESISAMKQACPDMLVGAGTILKVSQVDEAINAGAQFIVTPAFDAEITKYCLEHDIPILPGTSTPTDVQAAYKLGVDVVKFFPAEQAGGLAMIKAIAAPYNMMTFMPTGGIGPKNMKDYLAYEKILCVGGSWMVKKEWIEQRDFAKIAEETKKAVALLKEVR
ncbi:bifunctional 4-hydroxy-2-oxoglutarate aldolase/2-dehydro-3-deoxy-phosphogluconate aldolase [Dubosiella newyorkensis]|jgi:2-dehydro-3-deoxyphosphogluconate aldolase/(4S)-4-hydroxy-2-oxoglutarate aldolase|uniref:bifunctional 4-hydroxy-2-oxoglutarate aldolase/2-dehydro-3-deoxy-phosphogluconate aldolase n=1 Tax=Dubosiella newyorkensis TaxID=1862672 RepID=UPI0023574DD7|nr:bifunctional 4-hydroxy-2-oxoglutarate aldolase/2-dehydro-3-deoxy-phosphogluconate aldolase [Dubosiella newyorkensis]